MSWEGQRRPSFRGRSHVQAGRNPRGRMGGRRHDDHQRGRFRGNYNAHRTSHENLEIAVENDIVNIQEIGIPDGSTVRIAIQGCSHGAIDRIYDTLLLYERHTHNLGNLKVEKNEDDDKTKMESKCNSIDLLICCGDFQSLRNEQDLEGMAVPPKYKEMGSFYKYYAGVKRAPVLTIFVGGNHEASSYLQELYYGGWVAPNIYYLGACGVIQFKGLRIAGISGIYKQQDYRRGRFECPPYDNSSLRSVYHVRNFEVGRLKLLERLHVPRNDGHLNKNSPVVDIMISHDWPRGIEQHGNTGELIRKKSFFRQEIQENNLGSPSNEALLYSLRPKWWFSGHLHVKFEATVVHHQADKVSGSYPSKDAEANHDITSETTFIALEPSVASSDICSRNSEQFDLTQQMTKFLSLDKCLPRRHHLQIINIPSSGIDTDPKFTCHQLHYDLEWLAILQKTHHWTKTSRSNFSDPDIESIHVSDKDILSVRERLCEFNGTDNPTAIPENFTITAQPYGSADVHVAWNEGRMIGNPQTDRLLQILNLDHIVTVPYIFQQPNLAPNAMADINEIELYSSSDESKPMKTDEDENEIDLD